MKSKINEERSIALKKEYERLIWDKRIYEDLVKDLSIRAASVQKEIAQLEGNTKYRDLPQGSVLRFKDTDNNIIQCRLIEVSNKHYDLLTEEGNNEYKSYSVFGYKCNFADNLIELVCEDNGLELIEVINNK